MNWFSFGFSSSLVFLMLLIHNIQGLYENDICTNPNGVRGMCKSTQDCPVLCSLLHSGVQPITCSFPETGKYPIICCPPENSVTPSPRCNRQTQVTTTVPPEVASARKVARQKCVEYAKYVMVEVEDPATWDGTVMVDQCGITAETLIIDGEEAEPKEFPHMALIGYKNRDSPLWDCGGSLISEKFVLSAAHCSHRTKREPALWVKLGELDTQSENEEADPVVMNIIERIIHPQYSEKTRYNDIALFKLETEVKFNAYIRPTCLGTDPELRLENLIASGWGHTEFGGSSSSILMKVTLKRVSVDSCNNTYAQPIRLGRFTPQGILGEKMICAGDQGSKDTCQGDSGGPLQVAVKQPYCMYNVFGITSFGKGCGLGHPGVYTFVPYYVPWIVNHVWPQK